MYKPVIVNDTYFKLVEQGGASGNSIQLSNIGLTSDRTILLNEVGPNGAELLSVDLDSFEVQRKANQAEAVLPHPKINWTAVRAKTPSNPSSMTVSIYNMDLKQIMTSFQLPEHIKYWTWINDNELGMVLQSSVYHVSIKGLSQPNSKAEPRKIFDREGALSGIQGPVQVIRYNYGESDGFASLVGLSQENGQIVGNIQLVSIKLQKSQFLKGYYSCFGQAKIDQSPQLQDLFAFAEKDGLSGKLTISQLNKQPGQEKFKKIINFNYPAESQQDFPIFLGILSELSLAILLTKQGLMMLFDIPEGQFLYKQKVTQSNLITGAVNRDNKGIVSVSKQGEIIKIDVDEKQLVSFLKENSQIQNVNKIIQRVSIFGGLEGSEDFFRQEFQRFMQQGNYEEASRIVASSPGTILRNQQTLNVFKSLPKPLQGPHPVLKHFYILLETTKLNEVETREICQLVLNQQKPQMIQQWLNDNKLYLSESIGELIQPYDAQIAEQVYQKCGSKKVIAMQLQRGHVDQNVLNQTPDELLSQLRTLVQSDPQSALGLAEALQKGS